MTMTMTMTMFLKCMLDVNLLEEVSKEIFKKNYIFSIYFICVLFNIIGL